MNDRDLNRFLALVDKKENDCWNWIGSKSKGYGLFGINTDGKWSTHRAHRVSFQHFVGDCTGLIVCHACDNPSCVNPSHLFSGTQKDNLQDASNKNRIYKGGPNTPWNRGISHCKRGHELSGNNISIFRNRRVCKACQKLYRDNKKSMREGEKE